MLRSSLTAMFICAALLMSSIVLGQMTQEQRNAAIQQHVEKASQYAQKNQTDKAIFEFKEVLKINPNAVPAYLGIGQLYAMRKDQANAVKWLKAGLAKTKKGDELRSPLRVMLARVLLSFADTDAKRAKAIKEAEPILKAHVAEFPKDADGRRMLAAIYEQKGQTEQAIAQLAAWAAAAPKDPEARLFYGGGLMEGKRYDSALKEFREALKLSTDDRQKAMICLYMAQTQALREDPQAALLAIEEAAKLDPKNPDVFYAMGKMQTQIQDTENAQKSLTKALELLPANDPRITEIKQDLITLLSAAEKTDDMIAYYKTEIEKDPKNAQLRGQLGDAYRKAEKLDEAIVQYEKALEIDPKSTQPLVALGDIYERKGDLDKAARAMERIYELDPEQTETQVTRIAAMFQSARRPDDAIAALRRAITVVAKTDVLKTAAMYVQIARIHLVQNRLDDAVAAFSEAKKLSPEDLSSYQELAAYYGGHARLDLAKAEYDAYLAKYPDSSEAYRGLSWVVGRMGDKEGAFNCIKKALELNPTDTEALTTLTAWASADNTAAQMKPLFEASIAASAGAPEEWEIRQLYARMLEDAKLYQDALDQNNQILKLHPADRTTSTRIVGILEQMGRIDDAIAHVKKTIADNTAGPTVGTSYSNLLRLYGKKGDLGTYIEFLHSEMDRTPDEIAVCVALRNAYEQAKTPEKLGPDLEEALAKHSNRASILQMLVDTYMKDGQYDKALAHAQTISALDPSDANACVRVASICEKKGDLDGALVQYKKAADLQPRHRAAILAAANIYDGKGQYKDAALWYAKVVALYPKDDNVRRQLAQAYISAGNTSDAELSYKAVVEGEGVAQSKVEATTSLYGMAVTAGTVDQLKTYYDKLVADKPEEANRWLAYESLLKQMGKEAEFMPAILAAFDAKPGAEGMARVLVTRYKEQNNIPAAEAIVDKFMAAHTKDNNELAVAADMYTQLELPDKAIAAHTLVLAIWGDTSIAQPALKAKQGIGESYLAKKDYENARIWLSRAEDTGRPGRRVDPEIGINLGQAYEGLGRNEDALKEYERVLESDPTNSEAQANVKRLRETLGIKDENAGAPPPPGGG